MVRWNFAYAFCFCFPIAGMQLGRHIAKPGVPVLFELDVRYLLLLLFLMVCIGERAFVMYLQQKMSFTLFREVFT
jgi:hypothetical protein